MTSAMLYRVRIQLKGYVEYEIDAPNAQEAELVASDVLSSDPDAIENLDIQDISASRCWDGRVA